MKVIVPQMAGHNFDKAVEFGEVTELLPGRMSPFNLDLLSRKIKQRMNALKTEEKDFLCLSGPAITNCLIFHEWAKRFGRVELLLFHAREVRYIHRTFIEEENERAKKTSGADRKPHK